jgi:hypothetical protein
MRRTMPFLAAAVMTLAASLAAQPAPQTSPQPQWNWPARMVNPKALRPDTPPERLRTIMVDFTRTLGVRCSHCHVGVEGQPLSTFDFASDANPRKDVARGMIRLVTRLNRELLPEVLRPARTELNQPLVNCYTCHRGSTDPALAPAPPPERQTP